MKNTIKKFDEFNHKINETLTSTNDGYELDVEVRDSNNEDEYGKVTISYLDKEDTGGSPEIGIWFKDDIIRIQNIKGFLEILKTYNLI